MPLDAFQGDTFVAFVDVSGFARLVRNREKAAAALTQFYRCGFNALREQRRRIPTEPRVDGFFVSDCGILYGQHLREQQGEIERLSSVLGVLRDTGLCALRNDLMLTASVAYGHFEVSEMLEIQGMEKRPIMGDAYLAAFRTATRKANRACDRGNSASYAQVYQRR